MQTPDLALKGQRVRDFFNNECRALLSSYSNIEKLIPANKKKGAAHVAEEGRYIESILRTFLKKHLPKELEALSGFIIRPATKIGNHNRQRRKLEVDRHSNQLDIIVYDTSKFPVYERFEEFVIVPPEGVVSIISVKKNLYDSQIKDELENLKKAVNLCAHKNSNDEIVIAPTSSLVSFGNKIKPEKTHSERCEAIYSKVRAVNKNVTFDECINSIICLNGFSVFKTRPNSEITFNKKVTYVAFEHSEEQHLHFGLQFLLSGIFTSYYHKSRNSAIRPGFTSFPTDKKHDLTFGQIDVSQLRLKI